MSLIYITGLSGSGKSTICEELKKKGYQAHDADYEGFNTWCDKGSGKKILPPYTIKYGTKEFYKKYSWLTSEAKVKKLAKLARNKLIFLCGTSGNEVKIWNLFDKVICLVIEESTLRKRVATRTTNEFGKAEYELKMILDWHRTYPGDYLKMGAILVDANGTTNIVVDKILEICVPLYNIARCKNLK